MEENIDIIDENQSEKLEFKLDNFAGPLDLLITLIKKDKIEIEDVEISKLTEQYLSVMEDITSVDLELASEFIEYAAILIEIKSKKLLPKITDNEVEEIDEEYLIKLRLREYQMFKEVNEKLKDICKEWAVSKDLSHSLIFGIDAVVEGLYVNGVRDEIRINMVYDQMQIKIQILTHNAENLEESNTASDKKGVPDELELALIMLKNRFDHVRWIRKGQQLSLNIDADL
jgi:chromatin segregation and condensation protein Rec8/ScpA/Scc1 (kleisin family)